MSNLTIPRTGDVQANYWHGYISRSEAQKVFDEYGAIIVAQGQSLMKMDAAIACLMAKFNITTDEVNKWIVEQANKATVEPPTTQYEPEQLGRIA